MTDPSWQGAGTAATGGADSRTGATAARMVLGTALGRLRESAGLSAGDASAVSGLPVPLIAGMELGQADIIRMWDVAELYTAYGVSDLAERATLLGLARQANSREWWRAYQDVIPVWFEHYLGLEQAASLIRSFAVQTIPTLLQTPDYVRALIALGYGSAPGQDVQRRVELRMRRQHILHGTSPVRLWAVIDEAALRRVAGTRTVMREQLRHLIDMCDLPHVTIRILPFRLGGHVATRGPLTVLRLPDRQIPDVAFLEQLIGGRYFHTAAHLDFYRHILNQLAIAAEPAGPPQHILAQILRDT
jgi:Domain of unknown function (DUF5753)/Helix-turn-helix domain